jgi:hypothetical protein
VHRSKKPGLAREAGPGFLSAGSALTPVPYVRTAYRGLNPGRWDSLFREHQPQKARLSTVA